MRLQLRHYQREAYEFALSSLRQGHNPLIQMATGTGKSLVAAELTSHLRKNNGRVWVLAHVQELVAQNERTYKKHTGDPGAGVVCAGLNRKELDAPALFASIQSIINPALKGELLPPDVIIIDECHRVPHRTGESSQYEQLFALYPNARRVGLSATPWRMDGGLCCGKGEQFWFNDLAYRYTVAQGVTEGYLSPLVGVETEVQLALPLAPITGDFNNTEVTDLQNGEWLQSVAEALLLVASNRKHIAVYCPTVVASMRASAIIHNVTGWKTDVVTGSMTKSERVDTLFKFHSGETRVLVSIETLTTGWNMPELDCVVGLRPTTSSALHVQIMGRGTRIHEGKKNCLYLDFVGNLQRLGGCDTLETYVKQSAPLEPLEAVPAPPREPRKVYPGVTTLAPLDPTSGEQARDGAELTVQVHNVSAVAMNTRRGPALMVQYTCTTPEDARINATLFLSTDTDNPIARGFFAQRRLAVTLPVDPRKIGWMLKGATQPAYVTVRKSGKYWNTQQEHFE